MPRLRAEVLVVGGGATGAGVAWDAALRGFDVVLVERGDLAEGTTGRFHGLLHSGGRYAVKDRDAAVECIEENVIVRRTMADCIEDTGGLFVTTPDDDPAYGDRFLEGCRASGIPVEEHDVETAQRRVPRDAGARRAAADDEDVGGERGHPGDTTPAPRSGHRRAGARLNRTSRRSA